MDLMLLSRLATVIWFVGFVSSVSARLPAEELEALSVIARSLGKSGWSFDGGVDPCSGQPPWRNSDDSRVVCDANCGNSTRHVTEIYLKRENLNGSLPRQLVGLPFLKVIDLTRNYLSGTIPPEWGSMQSLRTMFMIPDNPRYGLKDWSAI